MESNDLNQLIIDWISGNKYMFPHENMQFLRGAGAVQIGPDGKRYEYLIIIYRDDKNQIRIYMSYDAPPDASNYNFEDRHYCNNKLNKLIIDIRKNYTENIVGNYKLINDGDSFHFAQIKKISKQK